MQLRLILRVYTWLRDYTFARWGLLGSDTCNCVFFTLALPVASIGGLMTFHNYY